MDEKKVTPLSKFIELSIERARQIYQKLYNGKSQTEFMIKFIDDFIESIL